MSDAREVWRSIIAYPLFAYDGRYKYEVSNLGRVRKAGYYGSRGKLFEPKLMSPRTDKNGCRRINLSESCHRYDVDVAKLVAERFVKNPFRYQYIRHLDGDKSNNCASNLEWVEKPVVDRQVYVGRCRPVQKMSEDGVLVEEYPSVTVASEANGVSRRVMYRWISSSWQVKGGFVWSYA